MSDFKRLGVDNVFMKALNEMNINTPSEIQEKAIPLLLDNDIDLIGQAQTGTGKTAAFGLPLLQKIDKDRGEVQAIVLCPTRELAQQIAKQLFRFTKYGNKIFTEAVFGGAYIQKQIDALRRPTHIVVATPGRLIDLIEKKAVSMEAVKYIVLDEADEMLSMGFKKELASILESVPNNANRWLFSATIPNEIKSIIKDYFSKDAAKIEVESKDVVNKNITHQFLICDPENKIYTLRQMLQANMEDRGVIFCRTKASAIKLVKQLQAKNIEADAIQGDLKQFERDKVMRAFKNKSVRVLVATDVAARGLDIDDLAFVIHYELPDKDEYYTHRSGRTARAGKTGVSVAFIHANEVRQIRHYEKTLNISFTQIREIK